MIPLVTPWIAAAHAGVSVAFLPFDAFFAAPLACLRAFVARLRSFVAFFGLAFPA